MAAEALRHDVLEEVLIQVVKKVDFKAVVMCLANNVLQLDVSSVEFTTDPVCAHCPSLLPAESERSQAVSI